MICTYMYTHHQLHTRECMVQDVCSRAALLGPLRSDSIAGDWPTKLALNAPGNSTQVLCMKYTKETRPSHITTSVDPSCQCFGALLVCPSMVVLNDGCLGADPQPHSQHVPLGGHLRDVLHQELQ